MVGTLRKLVWVFEFWNEMLVSNIRCKNLVWKARVSERFTRILRREGWDINDLSPLSWQFFREISWPLSCFKRLRVLKQIFVSRNFKYLNFDIMKCSSFLNLVFRKRRFIAENWLCFRACNSRIVTYDQEFCHVGWFCALITVYEIFPFEKFSLRKSWCCRKHVFVFEIVSLRNLNKVDQIIFFP